MHLNESGFFLLVAASALWFAAAAFTLTLMLPLNSRLARADSTSSPKQSLLDDTQWSVRPPVQRTLIVTSMLPRVAREYGHIWCAASTSAWAAWRSMPGRLTLRRAARP